MHHQSCYIMDRWVRHAPSELLYAFILLNEVIDKLTTCPYETSGNNLHPYNANRSHYERITVFFLVFNI